jgi:hypothetical protein
MRLADFENKYMRLHIPSGAGFVRAEKVYWLGGRVVSVWYHSAGKRGNGRIFLSWGVGKDLERVKEELKEFIKKEDENNV